MAECGFYCVTSNARSCCFYLIFTLVPTLGELDEEGKEECQDGENDDADEDVLGRFEVAVADIQIVCFV